jgi:hypothetical protein
MGLIASETSVVLIAGVAATIACAVVAVIAVAVVFAIGEGDPVAHVEHYGELTRAAHRLIPSGPVLSDPEGATSDAIGAFLAKKEALQALWPSRRRATRDAPQTYSSPAVPDFETRRSRRRDIPAAARSLDNVSVEPGKEDRRGFGRSELDGAQDYERRLETDADDLRHVIEHVAVAPATAFGPSSGELSSWMLSRAIQPSSAVSSPTSRRP